mgnify:FL=1
MAKQKQAMARNKILHLVDSVWDLPTRAERVTLAYRVLTACRAHDQEYSVREMLVLWNVSLCNQLDIAVESISDG